LVRREDATLVDPGLGAFVHVLGVRLKHKTLAGSKTPHTLRTIGSGAFRPGRAALRKAKMRKPRRVSTLSGDQLTSRTARHGLSLALRETIVLRELHEFGYREIAEVTGVPMGTVMSRLHRARSLLLRAWDTTDVGERTGH
jgi:Sigma-70, region 4